jgi:hypothetical protein
MMRWSNRMHDDSLWMVSTTVLPTHVMSCTFSITLCALVGSRPDVGLSQNSSVEPWMMSTPMETHHRLPPEMPVPSSPMYVFLEYCTTSFIIYSLRNLC